MTIIHIGIAIGVGIIIGLSFEIYRRFFRKPRMSINKPFRRSRDGDLLLSVIDPKTGKKDKIYVRYG